ncbi:hypothetical protein POAN111098_03255 [Polynucleobacter antarcticus]
MRCIDENRQTSIEDLLTFTAEIICTAIKGENTVVTPQIRVQVNPEVYFQIED